MRPREAIVISRTSQEAAHELHDENKYLQQITTVMLQNNRHTGQSVDPPSPPDFAVLMFVLQQSRYVLQQSRQALESAKLSRKSPLAPCHKHDACNLLTCTSHPAHQLLAGAPKWLQLAKISNSRVADKHTFGGPSV